MTLYFDERATYVLQTLKNANFDSWFVGGCVRDTLINKAFNDYDIATCACPDDVILLFHKNFEIDLKGQKFGCVRVNYAGMWCEITTLRRDINPDGRHTNIRFTSSLKEDASRRDFTINALYWNENGLFDFFNGQNDLIQHRVRFIGNATIRVQEDFLRILRFFRFSSIYADELDTEGLNACVFHQSGIQYLSGARVWGEWKKTLLQPNTPKVLQAIEAADIDITLFSGKINTKNYNTYKGNDVLLLTGLLFPSVHLAHLAHRLNLNSQQKEWLKIADNIALNQDFQELYMQYGNRAKELVWYYSSKYAKNSAEIFEQPFWQIQNPVFPLFGNDILQFGCQPGAIVGDCLQRTRQWWIKNNFTPDYEDCLDYAKSLLNK